MRIAVVGVLVLTSCGSTAPPPTPSATVALEVVPTPSCRDAAPPITGQLPPDRTGVTVPGRALFIDAGVIRVYEAGRIREVSTPYPAREPFARLTSAGRVVALIGAEVPGESHVWIESPTGGVGTLIKVPGLFSFESSTPLWSPSVSRLAYYDWGTTGALMIGLDGGIQHASMSEAIRSAAWRDDDEITLVTSAKQPWPITDATLWSWRPPAAPVKLAGPLALKSAPRWSPDGTTMATIEDMGGGRAVVLRGPSVRTLINERDLSSGPNGCLRSGIEFTFLTWSPDSKLLAIYGRGIGYFVAFVDVSGSRPPSIYAAPLNAAVCYIPPSLSWSGPYAVIPLFGPDCGAENAVALFDPSTGRVERYAPTSRKGYIATSGRWVATSNADGKGTAFISLDDPSVRMTVPLKRLVHFCCAQ